MQLVIWIVYFATDVYGHVALKAASGSQHVWDILFTPLGISAAVSWIISGISWIVILSKQPLITANTVSALTYVLVVLAGSAVFREPLSLGKLVGMLLVGIGIYLVLR